MGEHVHALARVEIAGSKHPRGTRINDRGSSPDGARAQQCGLGPLHPTRDGVG